MSKKTIIIYSLIIIIFVLFILLLVDMKKWNGLFNEESLSEESSRIIELLDENETKVTTSDSIKTEGVNLENYPKDDKGKYILDHNSFFGPGMNVYLDEISEESFLFWSPDYYNKDYDWDGKIDRVFMSRREEGPYSAVTSYFQIEFGNGSILELGPFGDTFTGIHIESADINDDGIPELLFTGIHSNNPDINYAEVAIFYQINGQYEFMDLPETKVTKNNPYKFGYELCVIDIEDDYITMGSQAFNLEASFQTGAYYDLPKKQVLDLYEEAMKEQKPINYDSVWAMQIVEYENRTALDIRIGIQIDFRVDRREAVITILYEDDAWHPVDFKIVDIISPWMIGL